MTRSRSVYVVDDDPSVGDAMERLLSIEGYDVRQYTSALAFLADRRDDGDAACVVLDVAMPELNGLDVQARLSEARDPIGIVFLTGHGDIPMTARAIKTGAVHFLTKPVNDSELLKAVREALAVSRERCSNARRQMNAQWRYDSLRPREREVFDRVVRGWTNKQIAADLGLQEITIKVHRGKVMRKMAAASVADLVKMSIVLGPS